ncbi:MAG TPA: alpha-N-arabinofuranosidase [Propionibacteriaceae bacterium]|nr:alpha-N-arabinofuranosidase [Propionibacteriaceae bacterium]
MATARLSLDRRRTIGPINDRLYGSFVEHLGRAVVDGIYEPSHPLADHRGFRTDVMDLVRELGVSTIRYPGGNYVSSFRWEDSVGPVESRPRRLDLAWHSTETNEVGLHEFSDWLDSVGSDLMLAVNLGTRGMEEALDLLEYANLRQGSALADQRIANGRAAPFDVRMWCLGNEMDGPWQIGQRSADDYGRLAAMTAKAMKAFDSTLELVACGSSNAFMPTFGEWERVVLNHTYNFVDFISCHAYYWLKDGDLDSFLGSATNMDHFIDTVVATIDHVKAVKRSDHVVNISFDEWNVWDQDRYNDIDKIKGVDNWPVAPRLLEDLYTVADAVVFGNLMISLLNHVDRVTSASLAQLVNVLAPIMTEPGGIAWRQTTFFPFALTSQLGRGVALRARLTSERYDTARYGSIPTVDAAATHDAESSRVSVFVVNRSRSDETDLTIELDGITPESEASATTLHDDDPSAANVLSDPERVGTQPNQSLILGGGMASVTLPPCSWTVLTFRG